MFNKIIQQDIATKENEIILTVDTSETEEAYILKVDMPGVEKNNIDIIIEEETLTIKGKVTIDREKFLYQEYQTSNYYRQFKLGTNIERDNIKAQLNNGVLTVTLLKAEKTRPKKIDIES